MAETSQIIGFQRGHIEAGLHGNEVRLRDQLGLRTLESSYFIFVPIYPRRLGTSGLRPQASAEDAIKTTLCSLGKDGNLTEV